MKIAVLPAGAETLRTWYLVTGDGGGAFEANFYNREILQKVTEATVVV